MIAKLRSILPESNCVISVVGAGGKTACIYKLARNLVNEGKRVLVTTTTKMYHPRIDSQETFNLHIVQPDEIISNFFGGSREISVAALSEDKELKKIIGYSPRQVDVIYKAGKFDCVIVEADGAEGKSIKAPADHEPMIPSSSNITIGVIGLDSLGYPLDERIVHRPEALATITGQEIGSIITENTLKSLVLSPDGLLKSVPEYCRKVVVLNKADTPALAEQGNELAAAILQENQKESTIEAVLVGSLVSKINV